MVNINPDRLVIPNSNLDPNIKLTLSFLSAHRTARLGGLIVYPIITTAGAIAKIPSVGLVALFCPICAGTHTLGVGRTTNSVGSLIKSGQLVTKEHASPDLTLEKLGKKFTHFYINRKKDLVFVNEPNKDFFKRMFGRKRISLSAEDIKVSRVRDFLRSYFPESIYSSRISLEHLEPKIQEQIHRILKARSRRFRWTAGTALLLTAVSELAVPGLNAKDLLQLAGFGASSGFLSTGAETRGHAEKLWELIDKKEDIIAPKFRNRYTRAKLTEGKPRVKVTFFGNIKPVKRRWLAMRKTHQLK